MEMEIIPDSCPNSPNVNDFEHEVPPPDPVIEIDLEQDENDDQFNPIVSDDESNNLSYEDLIINSDSEEDQTLYPHIPLENFCNDRDLQEDCEAGWKKVEIDDEEGLAPIPFMVTPSQLHINSDTRNPEDFFEALFDNRMWHQIAQSMNQYAEKRIQHLGTDALQRIEHPDYKKFARTNFWKPVMDKELKIFISHLIVMGILCKPELEKYWCRKGLAQTPFFGKWMSRNRFSAILFNLHLVDDSSNPAYGQVGHNPLAKVQPFMAMCQENFRHVYRPS